MGMCGGRGRSSGTCPWNKRGLPDTRTLVLDAIGPEASPRQTCGSRLCAVVSLQGDPRAGTLQRGNRVIKHDYILITCHYVIYSYISLLDYYFVGS